MVTVVCADHALQHVGALPTKSNSPITLKRNPRNFLNVYAECRTREIYWQNRDAPDREQSWGGEGRPNRRVILLVRDFIWFPPSRLVQGLRSTPQQAGKRLRSSSQPRSIEFEHPAGPRWPLTRRRLTNVTSGAERGRGALGGGGGAGRGLRGTCHVRQALEETDKD